MPRRNSYSRKQRGGGCAVNPVISVPCNQNVNLSQYAEPCSMFSQPTAPTQNGGGYYLDLASQRIGGQAPVNPVFEKIAPVEYPTQTGGAFQYITNPSTGRKVNVNGKVGKRVLKNYIKYTK